MKVLKFGGTSVANAKNIKLVLEIIKNKAIDTQLVVVVSAFSGVTDFLVLAAQKAAEKDISYKNIVSEIEQKHHIAIKELLPESEQKSTISGFNYELNLLKTLLDGCYLLGELSSRTSDTILSFGEIFSS